jgi:hypothetical protein
MYFKQLFIIVILSGLVGCAGTSTDVGEGKSSRGDCILQSSIRGYRVLDEQNLIIDASVRKSYHVTLQRRAFGLRSTWGIAFETPTGRVCAGFSEVVFDDHMGIEKIRIASIRALTPEDKDDLLIRFGKKQPDIEHTPAPREVEGADVEELDPDAGD